MRICVNDDMRVVTCATAPIACLLLLADCFLDLSRLAEGLGVVDGYDWRY